ncbi:MAG TPA: transposase [Vicinamibacterales bacterium]|nr:transposase [Vicinamibacterales bacterium]
MHINKRQEGDLARLRRLAAKERDAEQKDRLLPDNVTAWLLPPYSPELDPVERVWAWMRSHHLANRACRDYDHLLQAGAEAWQSLTPKRLRSLCRCSYLTHRKEL